MKNKLFILISFLVFGLSCSKDPINEMVQTEPAELSFSEFSFHEKTNSQQLLKDIKGRIYDDKIVGVMPYLSSSKVLVASFKINGATVKVDNVEQQSGVTANDFSKPVKYTIVGADGREKSFTVVLYSFTGLPVLYLETDGPVVSKDDYVNGNLVVDPNSRYTQDVTSIKLRMKGRGNSTWQMPKKPYKLKFDTGTELLGLPASKDWVLLANFADKSLMRNYLAFEMAKQFGVSFTPRNRFVEVFLNGEYMGNYLLTEQIQVGPNRVNINPMSKSDNTPETISGGYLLEIDARLDETYWFISNKGVPFTIKEPEKITPEQLNYIQEYVQKTEDVIFSDQFADPNEGYTKYIDVNSFVNWYLVNELMKNNDAKFYSSVYMYKDRNGKLSLGPVWDFDIAGGNINWNGNNQPEGWWIKEEASWIKKLFEDPAFSTKVKARWTELRQSSIPSLYTYLNEGANYLKYSQRENFNKWEYMYTKVWPNAVALGSHQNEVQYLKDWLTKRVEWMDRQFANGY